MTEPTEELLAQAGRWKIERDFTGRIRLYTDNVSGLPVTNDDLGALMLLLQKYLKE